MIEQSEKIKNFGFQKPPIGSPDSQSGSQNLFLDTLTPQGGAGGFWQEFLAGLFDRSFWPEKLAGKFGRIFWPDIPAKFSGQIFRRLGP